MSTVHNCRILYVENIQKCRVEAGKKVPSSTSGRLENNFPRSLFILIVSTRRGKYVGMDQLMYLLVFCLCTAFFSCSFFLLVCFRTQSLTQTLCSCHCLTLICHRMTTQCHFLQQ